MPYEVDERIVRGLDYYTSTVFEARSGALRGRRTRWVAGAGTTA